MISVFDHYAGNSYTFSDYYINGDEILTILSVTDPVDCPVDPCVTHQVDSLDVVKEYLEVLDFITQKISTPSQESQ